MSDQEIHEGLEGITVAETRLSFIDGEAGELVIGGYPLSELGGNATFEETLYLLYNDRLPTQSELEEFSDELAQYRSLPEGCLEVVRSAGEAGVVPMDALRMGAAAASLDQDGEDPERDKLVIVARLPTIVAAYWRARNGEEPLEPREDLSHAGNYLYMLTGEEPSDAQVGGLEAYLNTVVDHGLNASTFTGRVIVSTESDLYSAITGAIGALKGPLHGGAPGPVLRMLLDMYESGDVEGMLREKLEAGERLMGFGHRVYKVRDPRAEVLSSAAESFYQEDGDSDFFELAKEVETEAVDLLEEYKPGRRLDTNVEFYTAVLLHGIGIPDELFTTTFGIARAGGWTAHCLEQLENNRLVRPRGKYVGEKDRTWTPVDER
ncbi:citrate synthase/methylcitrate synthase [Salinirubrum litoreum]|uniref:Citrate synthase n=1 Tax=Salinirubrum litoreum TaxID=1126234 RepID=A0ABD5RCZ2_9EURY|nr:citrate synthase/methylcitrate synthase [Salinirubrum litoreum]